jgi:hypothetical protein
MVVLTAAGGLYAQANPELLRARDDAVRAFHDSPSLGRFSHAGVAIMQASDRYTLDRPDPSPPKNHEFELMKARLAAGVVVSRSIVPTPSPFAIPTSRVTLAMLPAVRPSFFRRDESPFVIALRPFKLVDADVVAVVDALSAMNRFTMRVRVAEPMFFSKNGGPLGAWDVGSVEARFDQGAPVQGVSREGQPTGYTVRSVKAPIGEQQCGEVGGSVIGARVNPAWASSILAWIGKPAPGLAIVTSRQAGGVAVHDKLATEIIDLDRDGVPDFSTWAGIDKSEFADDIDIPWKAVFVNLEGQWVLGAYRSVADCT